MTELFSMFNVNEIINLFLQNYVDTNVLDHIWQIVTLKTKG